MRIIIVCCFLLVSCSKKNNDTLTIKATPIDAFIENEMLKGSSVLNDPNRFVWGASVTKGKGGKYHMLYSTWECGDSIKKRN